MTPFWFVVLALIAYAVAYRVYGKWYDRTVWAPDPRRTTPAHMYADGVEYFPVNKYVLWGFQFKSITALGPILGPFVALQFGWGVALAWIILGNFFIGWLQDYSSIMVSVRNEGRSFGPIAHTLVGPEARRTLLAFLMFYLSLGVIAFLFPIARYWNTFPGTFAADMGIFATGIVVGRLLYRMRLNIWAVTAFALAGVALSVTLLGAYARTTPNFLGAWTGPFWAAVAAAVIYVAAVLPMPTFTQPALWTAFFPTYAAILLVLVGALLSPATGVALQQPAFKTLLAPIGPIWPILFVSIACGAISGWHSLAGSSITAKQLDREPDAHPIGAGAMLSEGLLALISLAAYMVLAPGSFNPTLGVEAWVMGTTKLTAAYLGGEAFFQTYFGAILVLYAVTLLTLVTRVWRLAIAEFVGERLPVLANKYVATFLALAICWVFVVWGSWVNLWIYLGSANQLMAGLALMLVSVHLARSGRPTLWSVVPGTFMIVTTLAAIAWTTVSNYVYRAFVLGEAQKMAQPPINQSPLASQVLALVLLFVGVWLFYYGVRMSVYLYRAYFRYRAAPLPEPTPVPAR